MRPLGTTDRKEGHGFANLVCVSFRWWAGLPACTSESFDEGRDSGCDTASSCAKTVRADDILPGLKELVATLDSIRWMRVVLTRGVSVIQYLDLKWVHHSITLYRTVKLCRENTQVPYGGYAGGRFDCVDRLRMPGRGLRRRQRH